MKYQGKIPDETTALQAANALMMSHQATMSHLPMREDEVMKTIINVNVLIFHLQKVNLFPFTAKSEKKRRSNRKNCGCLELTSTCKC